MASLFEEMGGTYTLGADGMYYPDLELPEEETPRYGKYGRMRLDYLKKHRRGTYTTLLTSCTLNQHLYDTEQKAKRQLRLPTPQNREQHSLVGHLLKDQVNILLHSNY